MTDNPENIVDLRSRKTFKQIEEEEAEKKQLAAEYDQFVEEDKKIAALSLLEDVRKLFEEGKLDGLVIAARHKQTGYFFTDVCFGPEGCNPQDAITWTGLLEMLKMEFADIGMMAPAIRNDGSIDENPLHHSE